MFAVKTMNGDCRKIKKYVKNGGPDDVSTVPDLRSEMLFSSPTLATADGEICSRRRFSNGQQKRLNLRIAGHIERDEAIVFRGRKMLGRLSNVA